MWFFIHFSIFIVVKFCFSRIFLNLQANDAIAFQGTNSSGSQLLVRFGRRKNGEAEIWLVLRIVDKTTGITTVLVHPEFPKTTVYGNKNEWDAGGLHCECREPMRRWRISYNGWMKKHSESEANQTEFVHVRFGFMYENQVFFLFKSKNSFWIFPNFFQFFKIFHSDTEFPFLFSAIGKKLNIFQTKVINGLKLLGSYLESRKRGKYFE